MITVVQLSEDAFANVYKPIANPFDPYAGFVWDERGGTLFETFGQQVEFVWQQDPQHVWTLLSCDDGDIIVSGRHVVNRLGYFITELAVPDGVDFEVDLES